MSVIDLIYYEYLYMSVIDLIYYLDGTLTLVSLQTNYIILTKSINTIIKQDYLLLRRV